MTPKEKAKELYEKYEFVYIPNYTSKHKVVQCARIAVELLLSEKKSDRDYAYIEDYWSQVLAELEKLARN